MAAGWGVSLATLGDTEPGPVIGRCRRTGAARRRVVAAVLRTGQLLEGGRRQTQTAAQEPAPRRRRTFGHDEPRRRRRWRRRRRQKRRLPPATLHVHGRHHVPGTARERNQRGAVGVGGVGGVGVGVQAPAGGQSRRRQVQKAAHIEEPVGSAQIVGRRRRVDGAGVVGVAGGGGGGGGLLLLPPFLGGVHEVGGALSKPPGIVFRSSLRVLCFDIEICDHS